MRGRKWKWTGSDSDVFTITGINTHFVYYEWPAHDAYGKPLGSSNHSFMGGVNKFLKNMEKGTYYYINEFNDYVKLIYGRTK